MKVFSPNMLKIFSQCPKKYDYKYVLNISAPQKQTPFEKGKKIHALANYYLKGDDITKFEKTLTSEEITAWEALKNNEYFQKQYIKSEYELSCKINGYWIGGRIDAIVKDENKFYILDYKTGAIPKSPENDYQTMVYMLAVNDFFKCNENLSFVYIDLKNNKNHVIDFSKAQKEKYINGITQICKDITCSNTFIENESNCKFCEYSKLC